MIKNNLNLNEFHCYVKDKKCICFGTGIQGLRFINIFENWGLTNNIIAFTDNDSKKWGSKIQYDKFSYPIISVNKALKFLKENVILVITCADFIQIRNQLYQEHNFQNIYCISLAELGQNELIISNYDSVVYEYQSPVIPKVIHYCWLGDEMPLSLRNNIEKWKFLCPDYEIIEWNESNYNIEKNSYAYQAYNMKKWGYAVDYIKLDLIYQYGGIFLDTDVDMIRRPDELLYQDGFASFDGSLLVNLGSGFGSKAGSNIIKELRDYYNNIDFFYSDGSFNRTSCMTHSYNVLKKHNIKINDTLQKIGDLNIYPMIFQGSCIYTRKKRITDKTFFLHYGTLSWLDKEIRLTINKIGSTFESNNLESYIH